MNLDTKEFLNILYIGDPHVCSKKIGRRLPSYPQDVLEKLKFCAELSHKLKAYTICLGDLFHYSGENNIEYLYALTEILQSFYHPMIVVEGNHDKGSFRLAKNDTLAFLNLVKVLSIKGDGFYEVVSVSGVPVGISYIHHGMPIPSELARPASVQYQIMVTHHDLAIGSSYPGAIPLKAIPGVDFVVNGHIHKQEKSKRIGSTLYHNPGNIEPLSIDLRGFEPKVWVWSPTQEDTSCLNPIDLPHNKDCFQLTGFHAKVADAVVLPDALAATEDTSSASCPIVDEVQFEMEPSQFAEKLMHTISAPKTEDASILEEDLTEILETGEYSQNTKDIFEAMLKKVQQDLKEN